MSSGFVAGGNKHGAEMGKPKFAKQVHLNLSTKQRHAMALPTIVALRDIRLLAHRSVLRSCRDDSVRLCKMVCNLDRVLSMRRR